jgi:hypothetical protein
MDRDGGHVPSQGNLADLLTDLLEWTATADTYRHSATWRAWRTWPNGWRGRIRMVTAGYVDGEACRARTGAAAPERPRSGTVNG